MQDGAHLHPARRITALPLALLLFFLPPPTPGRADAPAAVGTAIQRLIVAWQGQDLRAYQDAVADNYDYDGVKKMDLLRFVFGPGALLVDQLTYQILEIVPAGSGVATSLVDGSFTGHLNLPLAFPANPAVIGNLRLWIEERLQPDGQWRLSATRFVRLHYLSADWPGPKSLLHEDASVNNQSSVIVAPSAPVEAEGVSSYSLFDEAVSSYVLNLRVQVGAAAKNSQVLSQITSDDFSTNIDQRWTVDLNAPAKAGRYFLDAALFFRTPRPDGSLYILWDETTVPVVVK